MIMEPHNTSKQSQSSNKLNFASLQSKGSTQNIQPKLEESPSKMKEDHPLLQFQKEFPLRGLTVYVEILSNGTNISETCYSYLEKLGAKVEKRMNKKCNLIIWKDGPLKTIEKAKEYGVTVVNSLWLEDCIENFHCASYEKFAPSLPNEADLPFIATQNNKKKRKAADPMAFDTLTKDNVKLSPSKISGQRKKRKTTDKEPGSDIKVNIQIGSQKKLNDFFGSKQNKTVLASFNSLNLDEGPTNFNFNQTNNNRRFTFSHKIEYDRLESMQINEVDYGTTQKSLNNSISTDSRQQSLQKPLPPKLLTSGNVSQNNSERKEPVNLSKVKNMILNYAKTEVNTTEKKQPLKPETKSLEIKDMSSNSRSGSRLFRETRLSTSSLSRSQDRSADNSKMKTRSTNLFQNKREEESASGLEKILFKYFPDNQSKGKRVTGVADSKAKQNPEKMIVEDEQKKVDNKEVNDKKSNKKVVVKKESKAKEDKNVQNLSFSMLSEESNGVKTESNDQEFGSKPKSAAAKKNYSLPKNELISKYSEKPCYWNEIINLCGESKEDSQRAFTRSQSKKKIVSDYSQSNSSDLRDIENKLKFESLKSEAPSTSRKTKSLAPKKETKETRTSLVCKNLFDLGFSKKNVSRDKSADTKLKNARSDNESDVDDSSLRDSLHSNESRISRKRSIKPINGILFTNMSGPTLEKPKEFCEKFKFNFLEDELMHVPALEWLVYQGVQGFPTQNPQGGQECQLPRNFRVALTMARGKPVIKKEWIDNSLKAGKVENYEEYKFKYNNDVRKSLFDKMRFYIDKEFESLPRTMIGKKDLTSLITAAGGSIFDNVRACDFCVVKKAPKKKISVPAHVKVITIQWLIDSIIEGKFMNAQHVNYTVL